MPNTPSPEPEAARVELPDLPRPVVNFADHSYPAYSAKQMLEYAQAALALATPAQASVDIDYTNYRGERSVRTIVPTGRLLPGDPQFHPTAPWVIEAWDPEKGAMRTFDPAHIHRWGDATPAQADAAGTMGEVEDLVKRFGHYSQWVGEAATSDDLDRINPTRLEARAALLSAVRTIVTRAETAEAELSRLRAENAELRAGREWQDISTAPKDGSKFLAIDAKAPDRIWVVWRLGINQRDFVMDHHGGLVIGLTHWQQLPEPPRTLISTTQGARTDG